MVRLLQWDRQRRAIKQLLVLNSRTPEGLPHGDVLKRQFLLFGVQLCDTDGEAVHALLQGVDPERKGVCFIEELSKQVLCIFTEAAELADDVGQGDVSHTLQLVLDVSWQHRVAQVPGLDGALHQRHPSAEKPLPDTFVRRKKNPLIFSPSLLSSRVCHRVQKFKSPGRIHG